MRQLPLWGVLTAAWVVAGCASSQDALVKRRQAIEEFNAQFNKPVDVETYRSDEGVRQVTWGMTVEDVVRAKGEPAQRRADRLMYLDSVDGVETPTTYAFLEGHLAQVKSRFDTELPAAKLELALVQK